MSATLYFYWKLLLRRSPAMVLLFLVCGLLGLVLAARLPATYEAEARLLVESQQISSDLVGQAVNIEATEEIEIIRQQLMTRANLLEIADDHGVFPPGERMSPDEIVQAMQQATTISASGGSRRRGAAAQPILVDVVFAARTGPIAAAVANEYVTRITAANARLRAGTAENTLEFFEGQRDRLAEELDAQAAIIADFQRGNADALPAEQTFRFNRQSVLQEELVGLERRIDDLRESRALFVDVFEATGRIGGGAEAAVPQTREAARVEALEEELAQALTVYSDTAPQVAQLRARLERAREAAAAAAGTTPAETGTNPQQQLFEAQLARIDSQVAQTETEIVAVRAELASLADAIQRTPENGIILQGYQRDLDNIRAQYDTAVAQVARATVSEQIETTARGQRIVLIESATVPSEPASPNRPLIAAAGVGVGLALAAGLFVLLELLNGNVRRPVDIQRSLGIVPLATIPFIESRRHRVLRRVGQVTAVLIVLAGVPAALWAVDTHYMPLDLLAQRLLDKLGIA